MPILRYLQLWLRGGGACLHVADFVPATHPLGTGAKGNMVMSNIKEIVLGRGCCPFSIPEQASTKGTWSELNAQSRLVEHNDRMVSVAFSPLFILVAQ